MLAAGTAHFGFAVFNAAYIQVESGLALLAGDHHTLKLPK
jgi:hypothetical protein